uniref:DUF19 domain-containing protein n=2 Tax=Caenorhabditis japonica TaxID=281687 RepID=A0A8R1HS10_CAEJA
MFPSTTAEMSYDQLTAHCNDYYTCMDNTKCYRDVILYETLARCSEDAFQIGFMSHCNSRMQHIRRENEERVANCVKENFDNVVFI